MSSQALSFYPFKKALSIKMKRLFFSFFFVELRIMIGIKKTCHSSRGVNGKKRYYVLRRVNTCTSVLKSFEFGLNKAVGWNEEYKDLSIPFTYWLGNESEVRENWSNILSVILCSHLAPTVSFLQEGKILFFS